MELREQYTHDYTTRYYSNVSEQQFYRDLTKQYCQLRLMIFRNDQDILDHIQIQRYRDIGLSGSVISSVILISIYEKLPFFGRVKNQWAQFFNKLLIFGLPYSFVFIITGEMKEKSTWDQYVKYFGRYIVYKQTGDVRHINGIVSDL